VFSSLRSSWVSLLPAMVSRLASTPTASSSALKPGTSARTVRPSADSVTSTWTGCTNSASACNQSSRSRPKALPLLSKISKARRATELCSLCMLAKRSVAATSFSGVGEADFVGGILDAWSTIVLRSFLGARRLSGSPGGPDVVLGGQSSPRDGAGGDTHSLSPATPCFSRLPALGRGLISCCETSQCVRRCTVLHLADQGVQLLV